jgi:hypothetical protein
MAPTEPRGKGAKKKGLFDVKKKIYEMERNQMTIPRKGVRKKVIISWKKCVNSFISKWKRGFRGKFVLVHMYYKHFVI